MPLSPGLCWWGYRDPASVLTGALAVVFSGYLAAVYLAADSLRCSERTLATAFRHRALAAGLASGALALAGLFVRRHAGLDLTRVFHLATAPPDPPAR